MTDYIFPENHQEYTDKYFIRSNQILKHYGYNPWVYAQVSIRSNGNVYGVDEVVELIKPHISKSGGKVFTLNEGDGFKSNIPVMLIAARVQDIIELETLYLGVISYRTTKINDAVNLSMEMITEKVKAIQGLIGDRPLSYFGARHWTWEGDKDISLAAFKGGAESCSTDAGASVAQQKGIGTIPHALENIFAYYHGQENAVLEATKAFDVVVDKDVPRIALVDYNNREIADAIDCCEQIPDLYGVRVDTCGENKMEYRSRGHLFEYENTEYWDSNGVSIRGVMELRCALNKAGYEHIKIILTSGFANIEKVKAFVNAEKVLGMQLFDGLGIGGLYHSRAAHMDIVAVGDDLHNMTFMAKKGRGYVQNKNLKPRLELVGG
jgi:nicotinate phosphoribosyltransferase